MKQGKCEKCKVVYHWKGEAHSRVCRCPVHGTPLKATSRMSKLMRVAVPRERVVQEAG